jgi:hypothetical protein
MKKITLIACIVCSLNCWGQVYTVKTFFDESFTHRSWVGGSPFGGDYQKEQGLDTISVVLLVSDTATKVFTTTNYHKMVRKCDSCMFSYADDTTSYVNYSPLVIHAYSVREKYCCVNGNKGNLAYYQPVPYYEHLYYLDDKKQPLKPSIIVWQSVSK